MNLTDVAQLIRSQSRIDLHKDYWILQKKLRRQMEDTELTRSFSATSNAAADSTKGFVVVNFILALILNGVIQYLVLFMYSL